MGQRDNLILIAEDLGQRQLMDVLLTNKFWDPRAQTALVAEGLLMYLSDDAVQDLFCQCAAITGPGSRIAFSYIPTDTQGQIDVGRWTGLILWLQKLVGEPWTWGIQPKELGPFLVETGWKIPMGPVQTSCKYGVEFFAVAIK
jgi:O-methyltransferase involved in polyketide biosynthesis